VQPQLLKDIQSKLEARRSQLSAELSQFAAKRAGDRDAGSFEAGRSEDESAAEVTMYSDNLSLERTLEHALRDVMNALSRIEAGSYGTCRYCGEEIPEKRLAARPTSSSCVRCKMEKKKAA